MRYKTFVVAVIGLGLITSGCSDRPSESLAREGVSQKIDDGHSSRLRVVAFAKSDGQSSELAGVKMYRMTFTATLEFADDAFYTTGGSIMQPEVSINTASIANVPPTCAQNFAACVSQTPMRAGKGDKLKVTGTASFEKSESGWHISNLAMSLPDCAEVPGCASSSTSQSARTGSPSASPAPIARIAGNTGGPVPALHTDSVGNRRCVDFMARNPLPSAWYDRLLRRKVRVANALKPDTITLAVGERIGSLSRLSTGEMCIGDAAIEVLPKGYAAVLSHPDSAGYRLLTLQAVESWPRPNMLYYAWVVHPDSARPLSTDVFAGFTERGQIDARIPAQNAWSPDGRTFILVLNEARFESAKSPPFKTPGILSLTVPKAEVRFISLRNIYPGHSPFDCRDFGGKFSVPIVDAQRPEWLAPDILSVKLRTPSSGSCNPADSITVVQLDLSRGEVKP